MAKQALTLGRPQVSIIMPIWNAADTLERAIQSIQAQDFADWELCAVDDGSSDSSKAMIETFAALDPRIRLLQTQENKGAGHARNIGLDTARARYIAFLDSDDSWDPLKLSKQLAFMKENRAALTYTGFYRKTGQRVRQIHVPKSVTAKALPYGNVIGCLTVLYDKEQTEALRMPEVRKRQDFLFWMKILSKTGAARGLNEPLATYHCRQGSLSSNRLATVYATWRVYRDELSFSHAGTALRLSCHLVRRAMRG